MKDELYDFQKAEEAARVAKHNLDQILAAMDMQLRPGEEASVMQEALWRIDAFRHLAVEIAAYGECHCEDFEGNTHCPYCVACCVADTLDMEDQKSDLTNPYLYRQQENDPQI